MIKKNKELKLMANRIIRNHEELHRLKYVKFAVCESDEEKKKRDKVIFGDCNLYSKKYKWLHDYDFFIVIYTANCEAFGFDQHQMETLMYHELQHMGINEDGNEPTYYVVPHDVEEFWSIINTEGLDWSLRNRR